MAVTEHRAVPQLTIAPEGDLSPEREGRGGVVPDSIGVALSGGGVRAALFSLGVLVGLVETGEHRKVSTISSVSGGSIVNAAVAQSCCYSETNADDFEKEVAKPIADGLCGKGMLFFSRAGFVALIRAIGPRMGALLGFTLATFGPSFAGVSALAGRRGGVSWVWMAVMGSAIVVTALYLSRGFLQQGLYSSFLATVPRGEHRQLRDLEKSPTTHVVVATDLVSAAPVFFSREFVYCPTFGWGIPGKTRTACAVYASAAFPVVFPVRRVPRRRFRFQNGTSAPPYPRCLKLSDGGVYNNLGTDWFDELGEQPDEEIWPFGNLQLTQNLEPVARRIVVNAGAASRRIRRVPPFLAISRTMSVLYDNTVRPRLQTMRIDHERGNLRANIVIDISESPYHLARRLAKMDIAPFPKEHQRDAAACTERASLIEQLLGRLPESYWIEFARQTSTTKTKLTRAGLEPGARMMLHGYLSTVVAMHVLHGVPFPEHLRDEGFFLDLAGRRTRKSGSDGATSEEQELPRESESGEAAADDATSAGSGAR
jgi:predicted acylesterase/phospholipase RssA